MRTYLLIALVVAASCNKDKGKDKDKDRPPVPVTDKGSAGSGSGGGPAPAPPPSPDDAKLVAEAKKFVADFQEPLRKLIVDASVAEWANETDITKEHEAATAKAGQIQNDGVTKMVKDARKFDPILARLDPDTRRQLLLLKFSAQPSPDDPKQSEELAKTATEMTSIYGKGVCTKNPNGKEDCKDVEFYSKVLQTSHKPDELLATWKEWNDGVGHAELPLFTRYVELANTGAKAIGFKDVASLWKSNYDMPEDQFAASTDKLWSQVKPLYDQLHCYARRKLNEKYGDKVVAKTGPIPSHVFGNMWAQTWSYLYDDLEPFKGVAKIDVTPALQKSYDPIKMVKMGEAFYTSLGFDPLPASFWERSMFNHAKGKNVVCHASAWDVTFSDDLRIKMCINVNQEDLWVIHHELGHDFYFQHYYKLPILYQAGANDGFHEAIGDTIQLSMTPEYLKEKGLLDKVVKNDKATINGQMKVALEKIAFLPFGLMVDKWRWDVFSGQVKPEDYNKHWDDLRKQYQGIVPPVARTGSDFDPGAKFHVASNTPYMRYFLANILQFQFHRALCKATGFTGPLNECSIYNNKAAGEAYAKMLSLGASKPWQDALEQLTGTREMDATAILEYFAPLQKWLEEQNKGQTCGW
ncbi:MAG TPA: M2 family metallopeptidase [Kofleriaceae bacterium]|nr:M2 family metallopeptidase [Kofleriaceae bacterium]